MPRKVLLSSFLSGEIVHSVVAKKIGTSRSSIKPCRTRICCGKGWIFVGTIGLFYNKKATNLFCRVAFCVWLETRRHELALSRVKILTSLSKID